MQPPERPERAGSRFINRPNYIHKFYSLLKDQSVLHVVGDTLATYGSGKTTILSSLYNALRDHAEYRPIWLSLNLFSVFYLNPRARTVDKSDPDLLALNLVSYFQLIENLCGELIPGTGLEQKLLTQVLSSLQRGGWLDSVIMDGDIGQWQQAARQVLTQDQKIAFQDAVSETAAGITATFLEAYNRRGQHSMIDQRRPVVFADDYCRISTQPIGDWVLQDLAAGMQDTVMVVSHTGEHDLALSPRPRHVLRLSNFTPEEVFDYLEGRLDKQVIDENPTLAEDVYAFSEGHAQTVCLVADLIQYLSVDHAQRLLREAAQEIGPAQERPQERLARLVRGAVGYLLEYIDPPWVRDALRFGALARRFDGDLLRSLLLEASPSYKARYLEDRARVPDLDALIERLDAGPDEEEVPALQEAIAELQTPFDIEQAQRISLEMEKFSFVDQFQDEAGSCFRFHHFVSDRIKEMLREKEPVFEALQQHLVNYYSQKLANYGEQADASHYVKLYRYERSEWQTDVSEWLYHLTFTRERKKAHYEFVNVYIQAMQWWGYYLTYPFCERLLGQWESTQTEQKADIRLICDLKRFHKAYPLGSPEEKTGRRGWGVVRRCIERLFRYFELIDPETLELLDGAALDEDTAVMLVNLMELYAGCFRFPRPGEDIPRAVAVYSRAIEIARQYQNDYGAEYHLAYMAEMFVEQGRFDEAEDTANRSLAELDKDPRPFDPDVDYELLGLCTRILGDVALTRGDVVTAQERYFLASVYAYVFQYVQMPIPPDPYTEKLLNDLARVITRHLVEWAYQEDPDRGESVVRYIGEQWARFWPEWAAERPDIVVREALDAHDVEALRGWMFPRPVRQDDARLQDPVFVDSQLALAHILLSEPE